MRSLYRYTVLCIASVVLCACASMPHHPRNACLLLKEKSGIFTNWQRSLKKAEARYGIPMPVILATIYTESYFQSTAKPPRRKFLGFLPGKRLSSAYGYAQALESTWVHYRQETGNRFAIRTSFADSVDFIGWFLRKSVEENHISPTDAYHLYLTYYYGHNAYDSMKHHPSAMVQRAALKTQKMALLYADQLKECGLR